jgi:hypothetical protein
MDGGNMKDEYAEAKAIRARNIALKDERIQKRLKACVQYQSPVLISHLASAFGVDSNRIYRIARENGLEAALADADEKRSAHYHMKKSGRGAEGDRFGGKI